MRLFSGERRPYVQPIDPNLQTPDKSVFPDATGSQIRFLVAIVSAIKEIGLRIGIIENSTAVVAAKPVPVSPGEPNLFAGALVNVSRDKTARLATNQNKDLLTTHVITSIAGDQILCVPVGMVSVKCLTFTRSSSSLWTSSTPGFATDEKPTDPGAVAQTIGRIAGPQDPVSGAALCLFSSDIAGLSASIDGMEPAIPMGAAGQFWNGLKQWQSLAIANVAGLVDALAAKALTSDLVSHTGNTSNPHSVTKAQVGLGSVNNTSDLDKPVSTATQAALNGKANTSHNHTMSQIVSLNSVLNEKSNTNHTHVIADVASLQTALNNKADLSGANFTGDVHAESFVGTGYFESGLYGPGGATPHYYGEEINFSFGATGTLPAANLPSQAARRDQANTFSLGNTFTSNTSFNGDTYQGKLVLKKASEIYSSGHAGSRSPYTWGFPWVAGTGEQFFDTYNTRIWNLGGTLTVNLPSSTDGFSYAEGWFFFMNAGTLTLATTDSGGIHYKGTTAASHSITFAAGQSLKFCNWAGWWASLMG